MKRIVVACNAGVATSATIACKIKKLLEERGLEANVEATEITGLEQALRGACMYVCVYTMRRWRSPAAALFPLEKVRWIRCFPKQKNIRKAAG